MNATEASLFLPPSNPVMPSVQIDTLPVWSEQSHEYDALAARLRAIADSLQRWNAESHRLLSLQQASVLSPAQDARLRDLNSALDVYAGYLGDLGDTPEQPCITRANEPAEGIIE